MVTDKLIHVYVLNDKHFVFDGVLYTHSTLYNWELLFHTKSCFSFQQLNSNKCYLHKQLDGIYNYLPTLVKCSIIHGHTCKYSMMYTYYV